MLIRIVHARAKPGRWADFEREFFLTGPRKRSAPGLKTLWVLHDLDDVESGFVVAFWDELQNALDFERRAEHSELLDHPLPGDMEFHLCEVRSVWIRPA